VEGRELIVKIALTADNSNQKTDAQPTGEAAKSEATEAASKNEASS